MPRGFRSRRARSSPDGEPVASTTSSKERAAARAERRGRVTDPQVLDQAHFLRMLADQGHGRLGGRPGLVQDHGDQQSQLSVSQDGDLFQRLRMSTWSRISQAAATGSTKDRVVVGDRVGNRMEILLRKGKVLAKGAVPVQNSQNRALRDSVCPQPDRQNSHRRAGGVDFSDHPERPPVTESWRTRLFRRTRGPTRP